MTDDVEAMREIHNLRTDFREAVAEIRGAINTLAATKEGEVRDLSRQVSDVRHDHDNTKVTVTALHNRLDAYPDPDRLQDTLDDLNDKLDGLATHAEVEALTARLEDYPKAQDVNDAIDRTHANELSIVKLAAIAVVGGFAGQVLGSLGLF